jgi:hypothetical protein
MKIGNGSDKAGRRSKRPDGEAGTTATNGAPDGAGSPDAVQGAMAAVPVLHTREERIAIIAYYKAERRGFANSGELDDWLEAEREVDEAQGQEQSTR